MSAFIPECLHKHQDASVVKDAIYYIVRVLRNSIRGYRKTPVSTEPSKQARSLAKDAVREIERVERVSIPKLDNDTLNAYINILEEYLRGLYRNSHDISLDKAESILDELRSKPI